MQADFWHERWQNNQIGFHESEVNPLLLQHFSLLSLQQGDRVFLPLCGKTLDIGWLLSNGYRVAGCELSELAIRQLFAELRIKPDVTEHGPVKHYQGDNIDMYVGDLFALDSHLLGDVDGVYDRAALVALPDTMRPQYTKHLIELTHSAPQLVLCFEYDQSVMNGPPFSISSEMVAEYYDAYYKLQFVTRQDVAGGLKGKCPATEHVWLLQSV